MSENNDLDIFLESLEGNKMDLLIDALSEMDGESNYKDEILGLDTGQFYENVVWVDPYPFG